ncbi:hypothetical protein, partial [Rudaea sp.]|uniref:hypothetical protein n=1 Tax=Rudaea sp. TaxID=2136325 RepID=UPI003220506E
GAVSGRVSLGDFSLHEQREVTRSPQASGSSCSSVEKHQSQGLDFRLRGNDERKREQKARKAAC